MNVMRNLGGSVGISFITTFLARRSQLHPDRLVGNISATNPMYRQALNSIIANLSHHSGYNAAHALQQAYAQLFSHFSSRRHCFPTWIPFTSWVYWRSLQRPWYSSPNACSLEKLGWAIDCKKRQIDSAIMPPLPTEILLVPPSASRDRADGSPGPQSASF